MTSEDIPELMHRCRQQMEEAIADLALTHGTA
jgi:1-acyl-sn-glycerol-3-phosphate acyltransferase